MNLLTTRLKLTGTLGDRAFYDTARGHLWTIPTGAAVVLQVGLFQSDGTVDTTTNLATLSLEIYETRLDAALYLPAVATSTFDNITAETWANGSAQHAELALTSAQTNQLLTTGSKQCWAVVYGVDEDGERTDLAAGPVLLFRSNAGGTGPTEEPADLYPTNSEMAALVASIGGVATVDPPLTGFDDERGTKGSHCYDPTTGVMAYKVSAPTLADPELPHAWVAWQTFNS